MREDVIAFSRHEHLVLYDPAAIPAATPINPDLDAQDPKPLPPAAMTELAGQGLAVILRIAHEDCQANIRLMIDEDVEPHFRERATTAIDRAALRLPSGTLTVDGIEFLCRPGETRLHSEAQVMEVPAGDYRVQVFNLIPWKGRHREREIEMNTTRFDRFVDRMVTGYTWLGILLFPANVLLAPVAVLVVWMKSGERAALMLAGAVILIDFIVLTGFRVLKFASRWMPALDRRREVARAFEAENPDVVVCLNRSVDAEETSVPGFATMALG
jgi:hypothetical protein